MVQSVKTDDGGPSHKATVPQSQPRLLDGHQADDRLNNQIKMNQLVYQRLIQEDDQRRQRPNQHRIEEQRPNQRQEDLIAPVPIGQSEAPAPSRAPDLP